MIRWIFLIAVSLTLVVLASVVPASAGGWAVITLDTLPGQMISGQAYTLGFMVRQHGITPMANLTPTIHATNPATGDILTVSAGPAGEVGHYQATLSFPTEGSWRWSIDAFTMQQPMPDLNVLAPSQVQDSSALPGASPVSLTLVISGLLWAALAAWFALRNRSRRLVGLAVIGLLLAGAGFASANVRAFMPETSQVSQNLALSPAETGQALFVAKGCITCHQNQRIDRVETQNFASLRIGPDLSKFSASPEYLRLWLANPAALKPDTRMPDLNLSPGEIEALIAFLNAGSSTSMPPTSPAESISIKSCHVTEPVWVKPPDDAAVSNPPEYGYYYVNADRSIWASAWWKGEEDTYLRATNDGIKVGWFRPAGAALEITGQRIDAKAPALEAHAPCCYPTRFQATGLYFPSEGCWQVNARAEDSELSFIVRVAP